VIIERDLDHAARALHSAPLCPWCATFDHPAGRCPDVAGGGPWGKLREKDAEIAALRAQLAGADEHVGALTSAVDELDSLGEWVWSEPDEKTLLSIHLTESHHTELMDMMDAARAWLRRREGR
jgi:hypothetical protein